ncbi:helix-turn-helix transcriptional regulator [Flagellimonas sp. 389]|uniref:helix-turn-helix domain-containing protein n=1 Tax=Flagellimonas sp. 389 TaxID=2835862 RepID=UPI001BD63153|nr:helix-turn-helix transcriptional regulator [Flagellimonas sp. 389]MBS9463275.1 helix-turn-helix transcriptional regulator [Flagellimonas sp. 389]
MSEKFGDRIMQARKEKGLSREELAKMIGTSGPIVGRYERGDMMPSVEIATKIADALEISVDYLLGKTSLIIDKDAIRRLEDISKLNEENKAFILNLIDMALRDMKAKNAYA